MLFAGAAMLIAAPAVANAADAPAPPPATPAPTADTPGSSSALDEVIVTATKTGETVLQRTPIAVSAFSAADLDQSNSHNVKDLVQYTPSLNVAQVNASAAIYIRGVGSNNTLNGSDPDVTVQVDGVYQARAFEEFTDYLDVAQVEVLRGPQGTLYGRNAIGGVINVNSMQPTDTFEGKATLTVGNYDLVQTQAYVSGPLIPGVLDASIAVNDVHHDGYITNIAPGAEDALADANHGGVRVQLRWRPSEDVDATTRIYYTQLNEHPEGYDNILAPLPYAPIANSTIGDYTKVALAGEQTSYVASDGIAEDVKYTINSDLSLRSITAYQWGHSDFVSSAGATEINTEQVIQDETDRQFSQEFDLNANLGKWSVVTGAYYSYDKQTSYITSDVFPSPQVPAPKSFLVVVTPMSTGQSEAVFGQATYHVTDTLSATAGARYTADQKTLDQNYSKTSNNNSGVGPAFGSNLPNPIGPGFPFIADVRRDFSGFTPMGNIQWQATNNAMAYVSITKGYKSGGTNYAAASLSGLSFQPETIVSYESGLKTEWFEHRLRVNVTGFHYDYNGLQVQSLIGPGITAIGNAASARVNGGEFEIVAKPTSRLQLSANLSLLDATYQSFTKASVPSTLAPFLVGDPNYNPTTGTYNASGKRLNAAPKDSYSLAAQYNQPLGEGEVFGRVEYYWQDRVFYDPSNALIMSQAPYGLTNVVLGYNPPGKSWNLELIGKNLADTHYLITTAANAFTPAGFAGAPRTMMIQASVKF
jgi:iron complex outermembrane recepter protein